MKQQNNFDFLPEKLEETLEKSHEETLEKRINKLEEDVEKIKQAIRWDQM